MPSLFHPAFRTAQALNQGRPIRQVWHWGTQPVYPAPLGIGTGLGYGHNTQYCGSTKWTAVTAWAGTTAYVAGNLRRQSAAPTVGFERVFLCVQGGTSGGSEPLWSTPATAPAYDSLWADGTVQWREVTGRSAYGWSAPHARLANALTVPWCSPGDWVFVSNNHAETQAAAMSYSEPGTAALPNVIQCVNDAGSVPPVAADLTTGATITTTGNFALSIANNVLAYASYYGIAFSSGSGANTVALTVGLGWHKFDSCSLQLGGTGANCRIILGQLQATSGSAIELTNTTVKFAAATNSIQPLCRLTWTNTTAAILGTAPTSLFGSGFNASPTLCTIVGVDFSALTGNLVNVPIAVDFAEYYLQDCKLGSATVVLLGTQNVIGNVVITLANCDGSNTNYRYQRSSYQGTVTSETTAVRSGGATDGATPVSRKMVTTANSQFFSPLEDLPLIYPWSVAGVPVTLTVPIVTEAGGNPDLTANGLHTNDAWIEVEYLGTSGFPQGVFDTTTRASNFLSLPVSQPTDNTSVWANVLSAPVQQTLSVTVTPQVSGPIYIRVKLARPSTTMYYDPQVLSPATRSLMVGPSGYLNEELAATVNVGMRSGGKL